MEEELSSDIIVDVIEATIRVLIGTGLTRDDALQVMLVNCCGYVDVMVRPNSMKNITRILKRLFGVLMKLRQMSLSSQLNLHSVLFRFARGQPYECHSVCRIVFLTELYSALNSNSHLTQLGFNFDGLTRFNKIGNVAIFKPVAHGKIANAAPYYENCIRLVE